MVGSVETVVAVGIVVAVEVVGLLGTAGLEGEEVGLGTVAGVALGIAVVADLETVAVEGVGLEIVLE